MWLGDEEVPHGVFHPQDFPDIIYAGAPNRVTAVATNAV